MSRRVKRSQHFEITLQVDDSFVAPPRESQRNWLLNRAIKEFGDDLLHLDRLSRTFVPGSDDRGPTDREERALTDQEIMEDWQIPVMREMARAAAHLQGDVLEVGFGRGVASSFLQDLGVRSHTIVECNPAVVEQFHQWRLQFPNQRIHLLEGRWQDLVDQFEQYDAILFHTYPLDEQEFVTQVVQSETFADNFFPVAGRSLRAGGVFTYFTNEPDSLSRGHQRALWKHFSSIHLSQMQGLEIPLDTKDALWADSLVLITAVK